MASIFTKIINGEIPCHKIAETSQFFAFLDVRPLKRGHVLVVPKKEVDYLFDLDDTTYLGLQVFAKSIAVALRKSVPCKRIGVAVVGLEVPHAHIHLVPLDEVEDLNFKRDRVSMSETEFAELAAAIRKNL